MNLRSLNQQRDTAILTSSDIAKIRERSKPQVVVEQVDEDRVRWAQMHEKTLKTADGWTNSIQNERKARITRLQREAEEKEKELIELDIKEKSIQKDKKRKILEEAHQKAFLEKPEIRAVNTQLLLHEVQRDREDQMIIKQMKKSAEKMREDEIYEVEKQQVQEALEKEAEEKRKRKEEAKKTAEFFKQQRDEAFERKKKQKTEEAEDEAMLAIEAKRLLDNERLAELKRRDMARKQNEEIASRNADLLAFRERQKEIERLEEEKIRELAEKSMNDEEQRRELQYKKRTERQSKIDSLIQKQQHYLQQIKEKQENFEELQVGIQFEKDKQSMKHIQDKQEKLSMERHREFLDAQKKIEMKKKLASKKAPFPVDEETEKVVVADAALDTQKKSVLKEIADFQRHQIAEKKEREASERERERLEFQRMIEQEERKKLEAQEYAKEVLMSIKYKR